MSSNNLKLDSAIARADLLRDRIITFLGQDSGIFVVSAAPGSGKSILLLKLVKQLVESGKRVVVATQTNNQALNLTKDWFGETINGDSKFTLFSSSKYTRPKDLAPENWSTQFKNIPVGPRVIVGNAKKWAITTANDPVEEMGAHTLIVDEAYQMTWSTFMQLSPIAPRAVLIGDAGQIPPVVKVEGSAWDTSLMPPHWPAPQTAERLKSRLGERYQFGELETSWRIPEESLKFVQPFYPNISLKPVAFTGDRVMRWHSGSQPEGPIGEALKAASKGEPVLVTVPTGDEGAPQYTDDKVASVVAKILMSLFQYKTETMLEAVSSAKPGGEVAENLKLSDIMIVATKKAMLTALEDAVQPTIKGLADQTADGTYSPSVLNGGLLIDTPERSQGLQRRVVIVVHPLSGVATPSEFDLETGRLSVMASRHQVALFVVSRDTVKTALEENLPSATQALGVDDHVGVGHRQHVAFWNAFSEAQTIALSSDFVA
jgi:AAA domain